jgi:hypothetical protein
LQFLSACAFVAVGLVMAAGLLRATQPHEVVRDGKPEPITKTTTRAQMLEHFHLGYFTRSSKIPGGLCYWYEQRDAAATICFEDERSTAPPVGHPIP